MFCAFAAFADTDMSIYQGKDVSVRVASSGSTIKLSGTNVILGEETLQKVDSIVLKHYVSVKFENDKVTVSNPFDSLDVNVDGTNVEINSRYTAREIKYKFSGKCSDGSVMFSSLYKSNFEFDNLDLTSNGVNPPVYILSKKKTEVHLVGKNSLKNSANDTVAATMRAKGQFEFKGDGSLDITSVKGHGIQSSDYVEVKSGTINVNAESDGIHVNDYYLQLGGEVNINTKADGVDVGEGYFQIDGGSLVVKSSADEARGVRCSFLADKLNSGKVDFNGGNVDIQLSGKSSRGVKADKIVTVDGGDVLIVMGGATKMIDIDYTYTCGIKGDDNIVVNSGNLVVICQTTASNSRCLQGNNVSITGGRTVLFQLSSNVDSGAKKPYGIKADGSLTVEDKSNLYFSLEEEDDVKPFKLGTTMTVGGVSVPSGERDTYFDTYEELPEEFMSRFEDYVK